MSASPLLEIHNLSQVEREGGHRSPRPLFENLSLELAPGERLAVVAPSSEIAAALARTAALLRRPAAGRIVFEGREVTRAGGRELRALRRRLQYVGGESRRALAPRLTLDRLLAEPLDVHRLGTPAERRARVTAAAQAWGLNPYLLQSPASALSAALCQRAALARAALLEPRVIVTDNLTQRLEPSAAQPLLVRLAEHCEAAGLACLLVTLDPAQARAFASRLLTLHKNGQLRAA